MRNLSFIIFFFIANSIFAQEISLFNSTDSINKGIKLHDEEKYNEALEIYNQIERNDSNYVWAMVEKAITLNVLGEYEKTIELCTEGINFNTGYNNFFYNNLGAAYDDQGENNKALEVYLKSIEEFPYNYSLHFNLGVTYENLNEINKAIAAYQKAIDLNIYYSSSHYRLGRLLVNQGRLAPAMYALSFYILLDNRSERSRDALQILQNISNGIIDEPTESFDEDNPLEELNLILKSKIALDKKYKALVKIDDYYIKQLQVLCEKTPYIYDSQNFWLKVYAPFFKNLFNSKYFEYHTYYVFNAYNNQTINKWLNKNNSKRDAFIQWATQQINDIRKYTYVECNNKPYKVQRWFYDNNSLNAIGNSEIKDEETFYIGPWIYIYNTGKIETIGERDIEGRRQNEWKWFYPNGRLKKVGYLADNKWSGKYIGYHDNGIKSVETTYNNDSVNGVYRKYYKNGQLSNEAYYNMGKIIGKESYFHQNGNISTEYYYRNGKIDSLAIFYHGNKNPSSIIEVKNEVRHGNFKSFHLNNNINSEGKYINNLPVGNWKWYYETGELMTEGNYNEEGNLEGKLIRYKKNGNLEQTEFYENGELNGVVTEFDENGNAYAKLKFKKDIIEEYIYYNPNDSNVIFSQGKMKNKVLGIKSYYPDGKLKSIGTYNNKNRTGLWQYYSKNEFIYYSETYENGELQGKVNHYFPDNSLMSSENYISDNANGYVKYFHKNNNVSVEGRYLNNNREGEWLFYSPWNVITSREYYVKGEAHGYQVNYHADGSMFREIYYEDGIRNKFITYDTLGKIIDIAELKNGNGELKLLSFDSTLLSIGNYKNGYKNGNIIWYNSENKVDHETEYLYDKEHGSHIDYHINGNLKIEGNYKYGLTDGQWKYYHENGQIKYIINYLNGNYHGVYEHYDDNGQLSLKGQYVDDNRDGLFTYYSNGEIQIQRTYKDGILLSYSYLNTQGEFLEPIQIPNETGKAEAYFQNGKKSVEFTMDKGEYQGTSSYYFSNGNVHLKINYLNNQLHGIRSEFYNDGKIKSEKEFEYGNLHGKITYYAGEGYVEKIEHYQYDELNGVTEYFDKQGNVIKRENYKYGRKIL